MALYNAMDETGRARRKKGVDRLKVAQVAAQMLEQLTGPAASGQPVKTVHADPARGGPPLAPASPGSQTMAHGSPTPGRPQVAQVPVVPPTQLAPIGGPKVPPLVAAAGQAAPVVAPQGQFKNVSGGGPKAPPGVTADQLRGYDKYAGSPLEALARRLARQKAGISDLRAPGAKEKAVALGLLPGSEKNRVRPMRRRKAVV